jgi:hypothetical protein
MGCRALVAAQSATWDVDFDVVSKSVKEHAGNTWLCVGRLWLDRCVKEGKIGKMCYDFPTRLRELLVSPALP